MTETDVWERMDQEVLEVAVPAVIIWDLGEVRRDLCRLLAGHDQNVGPPQ